MGTREMISACIVLEEERFEVRQRVILAKQSPDTVVYFRPAIVPLVGLYFCKLVYQRLVYYEMLPTVRPW